MSSFQPTLFEKVENTNLVFRSTLVCSITGISPRQLDNWVKTHLIKPSKNSKVKSGYSRLYSFNDILLISLISEFISMGVSLQKIRIIINELRKKYKDKDLPKLTLICDGKSIYECQEGCDVVFDLLKKGQGVFGISLGNIYTDVQNKIHEVHYLTHNEVDEIAGDNLKIG